MYKAMKLGKTHQNALVALQDLREWVEGETPWVWGSPAQTRTLLDSLVERDLLDVEVRADGRTVYRPKPSPDAA